MRLKIVLIVLLPALLVLAAAVFLKQHSSHSKTATTTAVSTNIASVPAFVPVPAPESMPALAPQVVTNIMTPQEKQAAIDAEKDRLSSWEMNSDPASLSNILTDLNSPEKEVRMAAIEAAKQFDDTNAIPALKAAVNNTDDTDEKIALLKAADFIAVPDLAFSNPSDLPAKTPEQIQKDTQQKAANQANRQAEMQKPHSQNPHTPLAATPSGQ